LPLSTPSSTPSPSPSSNNHPQATHIPVTTGVTTHTVAAGRDRSTGPTKPKTPARTKIGPGHKRTTYRALSTLRTQGSRSPNSGSPILWIVLGALVVLLLAASGGVFIKMRHSKVTE
jgi:cobalamin biosynthesis Mg chelatase CobN